MAVWGIRDTHGAVAVVLVGEEAGKERALGRKSKVVKRICIVGKQVVYMYQCFKSS